MSVSVALRAGVPPFYVMDVWLAAAERQRSHGDLVNLSAGQPSAGAPEPVRAAAAAALHRGQLGYTVALGIPELRAAIAASYQDRHGLQVDLDDVVVTTGSSGGFLLTSCPASTSATAWRSAVPATRATETSWQHSDVRSSSWNAGRRPGSSRPCRCWPNSTRR